MGAQNGFQSIQCCMIWLRLYLNEIVLTWLCFFCQYHSLKSDERGYNCQHCGLATDDPGYTCQYHALMMDRRGKIPSTYHSWWYLRTHIRTCYQTDVSESVTYPAWTPGMTIGNANTSPVPPWLVFSVYVLRDRFERAIDWLITFPREICNKLTKCIACHNSVIYFTHWGRDKMAAIFQTTFSNAFYWMKMYQFRFSIGTAARFRNIADVKRIYYFRVYIVKPFLLRLLNMYFICNKILNWNSSGILSWRYSLILLPLGHSSNKII